MDNINIQRTGCAANASHGCWLLDKTKGHNMQIQKNNFVVTLKTEKEILEYFKAHISEEQRLLWLGFWIAHNHIAHRLEQIDESK